MADWKLVCRGCVHTGCAIRVYWNARSRLVGFVAPPVSAEDRRSLGLTSDDVLLLASVDLISQVVAEICLRRLIEP